MIEYINIHIGTVISDIMHAISQYMIYGLFLTRVVTRWGYPEFVVCDLSVTLMRLSKLLNGHNIIFVRCITPIRLVYDDEGFESEV